MNNRLINTMYVVFFVIVVEVTDKAALTILFCFSCFLGAIQDEVAGLRKDLKEKK